MKAKVFLVLVSLMVINLNCKSGTIKVISDPVQKKSTVKYEVVHKDLSDGILYGSYFIYEKEIKNFKHSDIRCELYFVEYFGLLGNQGNNIDKYAKILVNDLVYKIPITNCKKSNIFYTVKSGEKPPIEAYGRTTIIHSGVIKLSQKMVDKILRSEKYMIQVTCNKKSNTVYASKSQLNKLKKFILIDVEDQ